MDDPPGRWTAEDGPTAHYIYIYIYIQVHTHNIYIYIYIYVYIYNHIIVSYSLVYYILGIVLHSIKL